METFLSQKLIFPTILISFLFSVDYWEIQINNSSLSPAERMDKKSVEEKNKRKEGKTQRQHEWERDLKSWKRKIMEINLWKIIYCLKFSWNLYSLYASWIFICIFVVCTNYRFWWICIHSPKHKMHSKINPQWRNFKQLKISCLTLVKRAGDIIKYSCDHFIVTRHYFQINKVWITVLLLRAVLIIDIFGMNSTNKMTRTTIKYFYDIQY